MDDDSPDDTRPPGLDYQPRPLAAGRALVWGCSAAFLIALAVAAFLFPFFAAHI